MLVQFSVGSDGHLIAASNSQGIILWNFKNLQELPLPKQFADISKVSELHFSADNHSLAVSARGNIIHFLDLENQKKLYTFQGNDFKVSTGNYARKKYGFFFQGLSLSNDGNWLAIGGDDTITVRSRNRSIEPVTFSEGSEVPEGSMEPNWVQATAFDPSGNLLVTAGTGGQTRLWNWHERKQILSEPIKSNITQTLSIVFSPKGNLIATAGEDGSTNGVRLWNLAGEKLAELQGHRGHIRQVIFSPDGSLLATAGEDGTARIWDLSGQQLAEFKGVNGVESIAFSSDGKQLVTARLRENSDPPGFTRAELLQIEDLDKLLVQGCKWAGDYLHNKPKSDNDRHLCSGIDDSQKYEEAYKRLDTVYQEASRADAIRTPPQPDNSAEQDIGEVFQSGRALTSEAAEARAAKGSNWEKIYEAAIVKYREVIRMAEAPTRDSTGQTANAALKVDAYFNIGAVYMILKNYDEAVKALEQCKYWSPISDDKMLTNLGISYLRQTSPRPDLAKDVLKQATVLNPNNALAQQELKKLLERRR